MKQHRNDIKYSAFYAISLLFLLKCVAVKYLQRWQLCILYYVIWRMQMHVNLLFKANISQIQEGRGRSTKRTKGTEKGFEG